MRSGEARGGTGGRSCSGRKAARWPKVLGGFDLDEVDDLGNWGKVCDEVMSVHCWVFSNTSNTCNTCNILINVDVRK